MKWSIKGIDRSGQMVEGEREAESRFALVQETKAEGLTLISVTEIEGAESPSSPSTAGAFGLHLPWLGIKAKTVTMFTRQLADLTEAGVPLTESLRSLKSFEPTQRFAAVLDEVYTSIMQGQGFSEALSKKPDVFPKLYVSMVRVGETTGRLSDVLKGLAEFRERDEEIRGKIGSALTYPIFTLSFSVVLVYVMVSYILPGFEPIWKGSGLNLHQYPITEFLLGLSSLTHSFFDEMLMLILLAGLGFAWKQIMASPEARYAKDAFIFKVPVFSTFAEMAIMARITNTLGILVQSGINLVSAVKLTAETADNAVYEEALNLVAQHLSQGASLSEAIKATDRFPPMMVQVAGIAEHSGNLEEMLPRMATYYDRQLESSLKGITSLVEPITMVLVGGIVFVFVLGIFLPIMGIVQSLNNQVG